MCSGVGREGGREEGRSGEGVVVVVVRVGYEGKKVVLFAG